MMNPLWNALWVFLLMLCLSIAPAIAEVSPSPYQPCDRPTADGIGICYHGREIAQVMGHPGAGWLERPTREFEERPMKAIAALPWKSTDVVADIGAGTGYFSFRIAPNVAKVYAVDLQPEMLDLLKARQVELGIQNLEPVQGAIDTTNLAPNSIDYALFVDAYHEFSKPEEMMRSVGAALKPGGKAVLLEYKGENPLVPIKALHKMTQTQVRAELEPLGFEWVENKRVLPQQHLLIFKKPG